jgi:phytoene dehydrogenase-like protein
MIVIVGAGLAGLTCAKELVTAGEQVLVLEAADQVGGRVRTDRHEDGYLLDRGFQVVFTAYPAVRRHLDVGALKQRRFEPGAILVKDGKKYEIADPLRDPGSIVAGLLNPLISPADKLRVLRLRREIINLSAADIFSGKGQPGRQDESSNSICSDWALPRVVSSIPLRAHFTEASFLTAHLLQVLECSNSFLRCSRQARRSFRPRGCSLFQSN